MEQSINIIIGERIRIIREKYCISKTILAKELGITQQQLDKYEKGLNRISAARLYLLSKILNINIIYFFKEIVDEEKIKQLQNKENDLGTIKNLFSSLSYNDKKTITNILKAMQKK